MKICVCGGRDYEDKEKVYRVLDKLYNNVAPWIEFVIIHGDAKGADSLAKEWAEERNVQQIPFPANWKKYDNAAGPIRNKEMLDHGFDLLVAFPGGNGTENMKKITREKGIYVMEIK